MIEKVRKEMKWNDLYEKDCDIIEALKGLAEEAELAAQRKNRGIESLIRRLDSQFNTEEESGQLADQHSLAYFRSVHDGIIYLLDEAKRKSDLSEFINLVRIIEKAVKSQEEWKQRQVEQVTDSGHFDDAPCQRRNTRVPLNLDRTTTPRSFPVNWKRGTRRF